MQVSQYYNIAWIVIREVDLTMPLLQCLSEVNNDGLRYKHSTVYQNGILEVDNNGSMGKNGTFIIFNRQRSPVCGNHRLGSLSTVSYQCATHPYQGTGTGG